MSSEVNAESFAEFKNSFSYGSRNDLNFKFLKHLSEEAAGAFLQALLRRVIDGADTGDFAPLVEQVLQGQSEAYAAPTQWQYAEGPFTPLRQPLAESRLALLTSSGHFVAGRDPAPFGEAGMTQEEAIRRISEFMAMAPTLTPIPVDTPAEDLRVRHGGYDIRAVAADPNVALPLAHLRACRQTGRIGALADPAFSFVGACAQTRLLRESGPEWVAQFQAAGIEAVLLIPV